VPDRVTLFTKGIRPEPGARATVAVALVGVVPALVNVKVQGLVKFAGLTFVVGEMPSSPEKKLGVAGLDWPTIFRVMVAPVVTFVVVAVPVVPATTFGVTLVAP
jgi:hypothetical protein